MRIDIRSNGLALTEAARGYAARRLRYALARAVEQVQRVAVHLGEVDGPRGGTDRRCRVRVTLKSGADVVIDDVESDLYAVIDRAASRAGRCVARSVSRRPAVAADAANPATSAAKRLLPIATTE